MQLENKRKNMKNLMFLPVWCYALLLTGIAFFFEVCKLKQTSDDYMSMADNLMHQLRK